MQCFWLREVRKSALEAKGWLKEVAPRTEQRRWFARRVEHWDEFWKSQRTKLNAKPTARAPTLDGSWQGTVRLPYSAVCDVHNGAIVISGYLADQLLRWGASRTKWRASVHRLESYARRAGAEYRGARLADFRHPRDPLFCDAELDYTIRRTYGRHRG